MEIKKINSQLPIVYDNTESDLILVPPSVLDNKLRDFEGHNKINSSISSDITLAVALLLPVLTATFTDYSFIRGATIRGAFLTGFIFVLLRIFYSGYKLYYADSYDRISIINFLRSLEKSQENNKINKIKKKKKNK